MRDGVGAVGAIVSLHVGAAVGAALGAGVGAAVGAAEGEAVGAAVGLLVNNVVSTTPSVKLPSAHIVLHAASHDAVQTQPLPSRNCLYRNLYGYIMKKKKLKLK